MKKTMINNTHIEGYLYEHKLELKTSGAASKNPGTEFISGTISIATDEAMDNVVQVHFTYVTATTAKGSPNATYGVLKSIIDGKTGSIMEHGKENAGRIRIDSAIGLNEWYDTRNEGQLVSVKRNEGGFAHIVTDKLADEKQRATFEVDMLITGVTRLEPDEERNLPERMIVKGAVFDFRKKLLPVEFSTYGTGAMNYFEGLNPSNKTPVFTKVRGVQVSKTIVRVVTEESAFGDSYEKELRSSQRDFVITWAAPETYEWDSEDTLTAAELAEAISQREIDLAEIKKRQDEYQATKGNALSGAAKTTHKNDSYDF